MPTYTIRSATADNTLYTQDNTSYDGSVAFSGVGAGVATVSATLVNCGCYISSDPEAPNDGYNRTVYQFFASFDCSAITAGETINSVSLSLYGTGGATVGVSALKYDWGAAVDVSDWRNLAALSGLTTYATRSSVTWAGLQTFTNSGSTLVTDVTARGTVKVLVVTSTQKVGTFDSQGITFASGDNATAANRPTLTVVTTASAAWGTSYRPQVGQACKYRTSTGRVRHAIITAVSGSTVDLRVGRTTVSGVPYASAKGSTAAWLRGGR
jgi:hypothetical protein